MKNWRIRLEPWIIQDGNYGEFSVEQKASFALEIFWLGDVVRLPSASDKGAEPLAGSQYRITAQVIHSMPDWWVVDFGLRAYCMSAPPKDLKAGQFVGGEIDLGIDPFTYFERKALEVGAPELIYDWQLTEILKITTPLRTQKTWGGRPKPSIADPSHRHIMTIAKTKAWQDEIPHEELRYELHGELRGGPRRAL